MIDHEVKQALDRYCGIIANIKRQRDSLHFYENEAWSELLDTLNKNSVIPQLNGAYRDCAYDE